MARHSPVGLANRGRQTHKPRTTPAGLEARRPVVRGNLGLPRDHPKAAGAMALMYLLRRATGRPARLPPELDPPPEPKK